MYSAICLSSSFISECNIAEDLSQEHKWRKTVNNSGAGSICSNNFSYLCLPPQVPGEVADITAKVFDDGYAYVLLHRVNAIGQARK